MNVKKMFASLTGVLMLASAVTPMVTGAANYSDELKGAYEYAYSKNITTMSSIDGANMYGELTRGQLAKMIANWAEKENGTKVDETAVCSFADANTAEGDLAAYVKKACQMGLMGQGVDNFRPNDKVTRGEFGTTLSRALWGDKYNGGTPFYKNHLEALKEAKIMMKIDTPNQMEIRGFVMLMLQRSAEVVTPAECKDAAVILACALNGENCPAACKKPVDPNNQAEANLSGVVKAGDLAFAVVDYSSEIKSVAARGVSVFNTVKFGASEPIALESVTLERLGLSDKSAVDGVWFEKDGMAVSSKASLNSKGQLTTRFFRGFSVKGSEDLDLVVKLDSNSAGAEIAFRFIEAASSAKNVNLNNAKTSTYRTTSYAVATVDMTTKGADATYKFGDKTEYEFGRFTLAAQKGTNMEEGKDVSLKAVLFQNAKSANLAEVLKNVKITRDGKVVSKKVELEDKNMRVYFDNEVIPSGKKFTYVVLAEMGALDDAKAEVQLHVKKASRDITAEERDTKQRVLYKDLDGAADYTLALYTIEGGKIILAPKSTFPKAVEAGEGSTSVQVAEGTITVSEPIKLENLTIEEKNLGDFDKIENFKIEIDGSSYDGKLDSTKKKIVFADDMYVDKTSTIKMFVDVKAGTAGTVEFKDAIKGAQFVGANAGEYQNNGESFSPADKVAGAIKIAKIVIKTPKFTLKNKLSSSAKVVKGNSDVVTIFDGEITATKSKVAVSKLTVEQVTFPFAAGEQVELQLYVNGEAFSNATYSNTNKSLVFNNLGDLEQNGTMKIKIEALPSVADSASVVFDVKAEGTDNQSNTTESNTAKTVKLDIVDGSSVNVTNAVSSSTVVKEGADIELARFSVNVRNGATTLEKVVLNGTYTAIKDQKVSVEFNGTTVDATVDNAGAKIESDPLNENLEPGKYEFVVKANVNTDTVAGGVELATTNAVLTVDGGTTKTGTLNVKYKVLKAFPVLSLVKAADNTLVVKVENPSDSAHDLTITEFTVNNHANLGSSSLNDQVVAVAGTNAQPIAAAQQVTLGAGESTELKLDVKAATLQLEGLKVQFKDGATTYVYDITKDYTNVAKWGNLKITYKS